MIIPTGNEPQTFEVVKTYDLSALVGGGAQEITLWHWTGSIVLQRIWGVVTTPLGNHTVAYWRTNDGSSHADITTNTGVTLTGLAADSVVMKKTISTSAAAAISAGGAAAADITGTSLEMILGAKSGATTNLNYLFTTSDDPAQGVIEFHAVYYRTGGSGILVPA